MEIQCSQEKKEERKVPFPMSFLGLTCLPVAFLLAVTWFVMLRARGPNVISTPLMNWVEQESYRTIENILFVLHNI